MSKLRNIFRSEQDKVWESLAALWNGSYRRGGFNKKPQLTAFYKEWFILFDIESRGKAGYYTRIRAPYRNADSFYFRIFRRAIGNPPAWWPGLQDIEIGDPEFDRLYIIQGNSPEKIRDLLYPPLIRRIIGWQVNIELHNRIDPSWVTHPEREGLSELYFESPGALSNPQQMKDLYDLFAAILNQLCHLGSAYEDDPLSYKPS